MKPRKPRQSVDRLDVHEAVCAERYAQITETLSKIEEHLIQSDKKIQKLFDWRTGWISGVTVLIMLGAIGSWVFGSAKQFLEAILHR